MGYRVLRFGNAEIYQNLEGVVATIVQEAWVEMEKMGLRHQPLP